MSSTVRLAFVGCGGIARHHLRAVLGCAHPAQVVAAVDTQQANAEQFARLVPSNSKGKCQVGGALCAVMIQTIYCWDALDHAIPTKLVNSCQNYV